MVRIGGTNVPDAAALTLDGVVTDYKTVSSFRVGGYAVDATGAQFVGGTATDLRDGRFVRASGTVNAGVLRATRIEFIAATAPVVEVTGAIASFTDAKSPFSVRNTGTLVTPQTTYTRGDATNLGEGVLVKVEGPLVNGKLEAIKVDFLPPSAGIARVLFGTVSKPSAAADPRTFVLTPLPFEVKTTAATQYKKGVAADLKDGRSVKVAGSYDGLQFVADEIQFMDNAQDAPTFSVEGIASNVQPGSVVVDGKTVMLTPTTIYLRKGVAVKFDDLKNGAYGRYRGGQAQRHPVRRQRGAQGTGERLSVGARHRQRSRQRHGHRIPRRLAARQRRRQPADRPGQQVAEGHQERHRPRGRGNDRERAADGHTSEVPLTGASAAPERRRGIAFVRQLVAMRPVRPNPRACSRPQRDLSAAPVRCGAARRLLGKATPTRSRQAR